MKWRRWSGQTVRLINSSIFVSYHGHLVFRHFFCSFYNALDMSNPKIKSLRQKSKFGQDGSEKISAEYGELLNNPFNARAPYGV